MRVVPAFFAAMVFASLGIVQADELVSRIMFGSCARQNKPQPIWDAICDTQPDLFLLIGDNIYGDSDDMAVLKAKYDELMSKPGYQRLVKSCPLLATWDDHDYGVNDGGKEFAAKVQSQQLFNDVFNVPKDSPRRRRPGIYDAQIFGPVGKRVQVILLDTRYFRDPLRRRTVRPNGVGPYTGHDDDTKTILGKAQWHWLEEQLTQPAELRIIASSIQVVANQNGWETWGNFPAERQRLFDLVAKTKASGVMFISGDRHLAEMSMIAPEQSGVGYPIYDFTSSSLNQPGGDGNKNEVNRYRLGNGNYRKINFGSIVVDWTQADPPIRMMIHDGEGKPVMKWDIKLSDLQPSR